MAGYIKSMFDGIYTVLVGMKITNHHLFEKNVTVQYPDEDYPIPDNARNRLFNDIDDCTGCTACAKACPVNCIDIATVKVVPGDADAQPMKTSGKKKVLWVTQFDIDMAKCCFCSLCTEVCPTQSLVMTTEFEYSEYNREKLLYTFASMPDDMIKAKKADFAVAAAAKKKAAAAKKAADAAKAAEEKKDAE